MYHTPFSPSRSSFLAVKAETNWSFDHKDFQVLDMACVNLRDVYPVSITKATRMRNYSVHAVLGAGGTKESANAKRVIAGESLKDVDAKRRENSRIGEKLARCRALAARLDAGGRPRGFLSQVRPLH